VFNLLNDGGMTQWNSGANQLYSPNYLSRFNRTSSLQVQLSFKSGFDQTRSACGISESSRGAHLRQGCGGSTVAREN
jgi:hypothetical protein